MSRSTIRNERYTMAFGVDHAMGAFIQIWDEKVVRSEEEEDEGCPVIDIDSVFGCRCHCQQTLDDNPRLKRVWRDTLAAWKDAQKRLGGEQPNLGEHNIVAFVEALGFSGGGSQGHHAEDLRTLGLRR